MYIWHIAVETLRKIVRWHRDELKKDDLFSASVFLMGVMLLIILVPPLFAITVATNGLFIGTLVSLGAILLLPLVSFWFAVFLLALAIFFNSIVTTIGNVVNNFADGGRKQKNSRTMEPEYERMFYDLIDSDDDNDGLPEDPAFGWSSAPPVAGISNNDLADQASPSDFSFPSSEEIQSLMDDEDDNYFQQGK